MINNTLARLKESDGGVSSSHEWYTLVAALAREGRNELWRHPLVVTILSLAARDTAQHSGVAVCEPLLDAQLETQLPSLASVPDDDLALHLPHAGASTLSLDALVRLLAAHSFRRIVEPPSLPFKRTPSLPPLPRSTSAPADRVVLPANVYDTVHRHRWREFIADPQAYREYPAALFPELDATIVEQLLSIADNKTHVDRISFNDDVLINARLSDNTDVQVKIIRNIPVSLWGGGKTTIYQLLLNTLFDCRRVEW
jgi:hypothetical protein